MENVWLAEAATTAANWKRRRDFASAKRAEKRRVIWIRAIDAARSWLLTQTHNDYKNYYSRRFKLLQLRKRISSHDNEYRLVDSPIVVFENWSFLFTNELVLQFFFSFLPFYWILKIKLETTKCWECQTHPSTTYKTVRIFLFFFFSFCSLSSVDADSR